MKHQGKVMLLAGAACIGSLSAAVFTPYEGEAAVAVIDQQNLAVNKVTAENTTQSLIRLISQLELDIKNIASMDKGALALHLTGLDAEYLRLKERLASFEGGMNPSKKEPFDEKGMRVQDLLGGGFDTGKHWNLLGAHYKQLEKTYKDAMHLSKEIQDLSSDYSKIEKILKAAANAEGQKEVMQANAQMDSVTASSVMEGNLLLSQQNAMIAEKYQQENLEKAAAKAAMDASVQVTRETVEKAAVHQPKSNREVYLSMYPRWLADQY